MRSAPFAASTTMPSRMSRLSGAALQAGLALRRQILEAASALLQAAPENLDIRDGIVVDAANGAERMPLADFARLVYYRGNELPPDLKPELIATRH
ncbi:MAG TPA: molybdopterin cofactor-binding domain-containing protein, partial [Afifellaceae bacterium]|nr:molybdopterin cofactor-binding domain-containing protein [Afifellaceae bacterium]